MTEEKEDTPIDFEKDYWITHPYNFIIDLDAFDNIVIYINKKQYTIPITQAFKARVLSIIEQLGATVDERESTDKTDL
jgi:hypothetical protein